MMDFLLGAAEAAAGLLDPFNLGGFLAAGVLIRGMWPALGGGVLWGIALMLVAHNLTGFSIVGTLPAALFGTVIGSLAATWVIWEIAAVVRRVRASFASAATPSPGAEVGSPRRKGDGD
jgi:hypothetical protein